MFSTSSIDSEASDPKASNEPSPIVNTLKVKINRMKRKLTFAYSS